MRLTSVLTTLAAVATTAVLLAGPATGLPSAAAEVRADGPATWWTSTYPFAAPDDEVLFNPTVRGKQRRLDLPTGASSLYQVRRLRWQGWGTRRAVGTGRVRYCDDTCTPWSSARIVLSKRETIDCADGADASAHDIHQVYRRSRVWGFTYLAPGTRTTVPPGVTRCSD